MAVSREAPESQFAYVVVAARRARQLMMGGRPMVDKPASAQDHAHCRRRIAARSPRIPDDRSDGRHRGQRQGRESGASN